MLYRSNIRSLWEYAAPLMSIALKDTEFDLIEAVQERSLAWVMGTSDHSGHQYRRLFRSLSGIESIVDRFETLQIQFGIHVANSSANRIKYLNKSSRHRISAADVSLYIKDNDLSKLEIRWRKSTIFFKKTCVSCKRPFRLSHLKDCYNITGKDALFNFKDICELESRLKVIKSMYE
ncbi:hypothetical protein AYI70_g10156 [Smittium culicis]|uniref:Uncharacterized protein n=1 Tax=Smittium culicis TaxID=133412 RepID=A0A1R1X7W1_9FUNG|nr:hypothetical protein AYI70_g10156 [Smittium culicis]